MAGAAWVIGGQAGRRLKAPGWADTAGEIDLSGRRMLKTPGNKVQASYGRA